MTQMDKYIFCKKKALDNESCNHIINIFEKSNPEPNVRDYDAIYPSFTDRKFEFLKPILRKCIEEYVEKHKFLKFLYCSWDIDNGFHIQRYYPGHYYDSRYDVVKCEGHMEHGASHFDSRRLLGWMFYLNDIKKDGGTRFPQQNFTTKPRAGDLYIWPAGWTHSHYGIPAPKEIKYIITGWSSFLGDGS